MSNWFNSFFPDVIDGEMKQLLKYLNLPDSIDEILSLEWVLGEPQMETMVKRCVLEPCFCHMFCRILQRWADRFLDQGKFVE